MTRSRLPEHDGSAVERSPEVDGGSEEYQPHAGGRRPGQSGSREAILAVARDSFAKLGYAGTTIRAIAAEAKVDPALVLHFYRSKEALFAVCLALPADVAEIVSTLLAGDPDTVGERVTRFYLRLWEEPRTGAPLQAMMRSIASSEDASRMAHEFISSQLIGHATTALKQEQPELRVTLASAHLAGIMFARHIVGVEPLASTSIESLVAYVTPSIQRYLTGNLPTQTD